MDEVEDEPLFCERVAGIDIGKTTIMVTIRVPSDTRRGRRQQETREFRAVRKDLLAPADWLRCWGVTRIGMEATGDYWKPVYFLLEREGFDCVLYHASQVKALPGRPKTDPLTELSGGVPQVSGRMGVLVATVADHDHRRRCAAGPVPAGDAAGRVA
jgi:transposase